jgi:predicted transcriptional regulator
LSNVVKVACSPTRLRILNLLTSRPHTMQELASLLEVTPQAVMKHLKVLERYGLVKNVEAEEFGKQIVCLTRFVDAYLYSDRSLDSISIYVAKSSQTSESDFEFEAKSFAETLRGVDDEIYLLKRRLKALKNKEHRLYKRLIELYNLKQSILSKKGFTPIDNLILGILESKDPQKTAEEVAKALNCTSKEIFGLMEKFKERYLKEG